ncbi:MAG: NTP transferase domain-containing protein [Firmicutes bacterium]|nr:NTP transferase domain-containing protein [Bacillota bacterium]
MKHTTSPALVIMAAGMGSRFGGLKQMAPIGLQGEPILAYSIHDAKLAGFRKFVFVIKHEIEEDFRRLITDRIADADVELVFQQLSDLPEGYSVPEGRTKPWGTGHAVLTAGQALDCPFAVINADDYYGRDGFKTIYDFLAQLPAEIAASEEKTGSPVGTAANPYRFCMVGYDLVNTLTENGTVARGCCEVKDGLLDTITERVKIQRRPELTPAGGTLAPVAFSEDGGETWTSMPEDTIVSMNLWGFSGHFFRELTDRFPAFLDSADPLKGEYPLPGVVDQLLKEEKATVTVLHSRDRWYGVTYREDLETVQQALQGMQKSGLYPEKLF